MGEADALRMPELFPKDMGTEPRLTFGVGVVASAQDAESTACEVRQAHGNRDGHLGRQADRYGHRQGPQARQAEEEEVIHARCREPCINFG